MHSPYGDQCAALASHPLRSPKTKVMMSESAELGWMAMPDGVALRTRTWRHVSSTGLRGCVLIVHGIGEHSGRYPHVAKALNQWGFDVIGFDHFGHGESPGKRGTLTTATRLLDDLAVMVDHVRTASPFGTPFILLGHSMGGVLAARFVAEQVRPVDGLVLSSPAIASGMKAWQRVLANALANMAPAFTIANGLPSDAISHDVEEVAAYRADPLVHDRVSGRLAQFVDASGAPVLAAAPTWQVPTLLMFAGSDRLVDAEGSRRFAALAPKGVVTAQEFPGHFHELFNEVNRAPVFDALKRWLGQRFPG